MPRAAGLGWRRGRCGAARRRCCGRRGRAGWPRTLRLVWSIAASRWTCAPPWWPLPRRVLPSTATTRRGRGGGGDGLDCGCWSASHWLMTRSNASGSTRASTRRTVASPGGRQTRRSGSRRTPSAARTGWGASLAHSPIAARDLAPASTAATATANTAPSACRRPRRWRGSAIWAREPSRLRHWSGASAAGGASRWAGEREAHLVALRSGALVWLADLGVGGRLDDPGPERVKVTLEPMAASRSTTSRSTGGSVSFAPGSRRPAPLPHRQPVRKPVRPRPAQPTSLDKAPST
jgi:hypothetical protein